MQHGNDGFIVGGTNDPTLKKNFPPRYCLRCQAELPVPGSVPADCGECQLQYDDKNPDTFRNSRDVLWWKYWLPGFLLALFSGTISYVICMTSGEWGFGLFIGVPVSAGAILGYGTRIRYWLLGGLAICCLCGMVFALLAMDLAGFFCGMTLSVLMLLPMFFGVLMGVFLRFILRRTSWDQRWFFPMVLLMLLPHAMQFVENRLPRRTEYETVRTELHVHATPEEAWNAIMFYEEVEHDPPWLLQLALPKPIRSEGRKDREGEIVRCFYDRGYLVKRISKVDAGRKLTFEVVDQHLHFENDVTLREGSFEIEPTANGETTIILTTKYERHLRPTWMWRSIEVEVIHTLHGHVLEGMRRAAEDSHCKETEQTPPSTNGRDRRIADHQNDRQIGLDVAANGS